MADVVLEIIRTLVLAGLLGGLWFFGSRQTQKDRLGWNLILGGFALLLLGSVVDITDEFENLNRFVVIGNTETQAFIEKVVGFSGGIIVLSIGLLRWLSNIGSVATANEKYKKIVETSSQGIVVFDLIKSVYLDVNQAFCDMVGETRAQIIGTTPYRFIHQDSLEDFKQSLIRAASKKDRSYRLTLVHKDGHKIETYVRASTTSFDEEGNPTESCAFIADISAQQEAEQELETYRDHLAELVEERTKALHDEIESRELMEIALREREEFFRALFNNAAVGISVVNTNGNYVQYNNLWAEMLGYDAYELDTLSPIEVTHPEDREYSWESLNKVLNGENKSHRFEKRYIRKDGSILWADLSVAQIKDENGKVIAAMNVVADITERKNTERELAQTSAQLKLTLDHIPGSLFQTDKSGTIIRANDLFYELFQIPEGVGELGSSIAELYLFQARRGDLGHDADVQTLVKRALEEYHSGRISVYERHIPYGPSLELRRSPTEDGGVLIIGVDITDRKKAEAELARQRDLLQTVISSVDQGIFLVGEDQQITLFNKRLSTLTGLQEEYLQQYPSFDEAIIHWYDIWKLDKARLKNALSRGRQRRFEMFEVVSGDKTLEVRNSPLPDGGFVRTLTDITERKKSEREIVEARNAAEAATKAKSDFLANMSHEIRTPLNAVIGLNYLTQQTDLTVQQREYIEKMNRASKTLLGIINDILDFSKIEAGRMELEVAKFSLADVLHNLSDMMLPKIEEKGLTFLYRVAPDVPYDLEGDTLRLSQVLINLTSNAVKFTEKGEITIDVCRKEIHGDEITLLFSVQDSGIGLSPSQIDRLFESFTQADQSTTRKYGGTGLGLTISKNLTRLMGGEIGVKSQLGKGSSFFFTAVFKHEGIPDRTVDVPEAMKNNQVLLIDQNASSLSVVSSMLRDLSLKVLTAQTFEEAKSILDETKEGAPVDLVLADWQVGGEGGVGLLKNIQKTYPKGNQPRYGLMVSSNKKAEAVEKVKSIRLNGLVIKPIEPASLLDGLCTIADDQRILSEAHTVDNDAKGLLEQIAGARILLVEDSGVNQLVAQGILEDAGLVVEIANNGQEAVDKVVGEKRGEEFGAILMDLQMPVMDGFEATKLIREKYQTDQVAIIAMTAHALDEDRQKCLDAGMNDHVSKPVEPADLFAALLRWVEKDRIFTETGTMKAKDVSFSRSIDDWPDDLPGLEISIALNRLNNNRTAYLKILEIFLRDNRDVVQDLEGFVGDKDFTRAKALAHALKGVAGNIAATNLYEAAKALDDALKEGQNEDVAELIATLARAFDIAWGSIQRLTRWDQQDDKGAVEKTLLELHGLLKNNNMMARKKFNDLKDILDQETVRAEIVEMDQLVARLNLKGATVPLAKIAEKLGISLTPN